MKAKKITAALLAAAMSAALLTGCGSSYEPTETVAVLDGREIELGLVNFMAQVTAVTYDAYLGSSYGTEMWNTDLSGSGSTLAEDLRNDTIDDVEEYYLLEAHLEDYGVEITDDELALMDQYAAEFMENNSEDTLEKMGATEEYAKEMFRLYTIQQKMHEAIIADADTEVSDEEAAQRTFSYYNIVLPEEDDAEAVSDTEAVEESTEEQEAELLAYAEEVGQAAKEDFDAVADTYGLNLATHSYGADEDTFDENVIAAADALSEGEISDVVESTDGRYYVVRLDSEFDEEATQSKKDEIISERQTELYDGVVQGYKDEADWTLHEDVLASINFDVMYTIATDDTATEDTEAVSGETADSMESTEE